MVLQEKLNASCLSHALSFLCPTPPSSLYKVADRQPMCEQASRMPGERAGEEAWGDTSTHQTEDAEDEEARIQHCEPLYFSES